MNRVDKDIQDMPWSALSSLWNASASPTLQISLTICETIWSLHTLVGSTLPKCYLEIMPLNAWLRISPNNTHKVEESQVQKFYVLCSKPLHSRTHLASRCNSQRGFHHKQFSQDFSQIFNKFWLAFFNPFCFSWGRYFLLTWFLVDCFLILHFLILQY